MKFQDLLSKYKSDWEKTKINEIEEVRINEKLKAKKEADRISKIKLKDEIKKFSENYEKEINEKTDLITKNKRLELEKSRIEKEAEQIKRDRDIDIDSAVHKAIKEHENKTIKHI